MAKNRTLPTISAIRRAASTVVQRASAPDPGQHRRSIDLVRHRYFGRLDGAAAHLVHPGDKVIIISYAQVEDAEARALLPRVVHVDEGNRIVSLGADPAEPVPGDDEQARSPLSL